LSRIAVLPYLLPVAGVKLVACDETGR